MGYTYAYKIFTCDNYKGSLAYRQYHIHAVITFQIRENPPLTNGFITVWNFRNIL